jgi:hypothetical protein
MTVSYIASASVGNINNVDQTSVVCSKPSGTVQGDIMIAVFTAPYTGSLTYTAPSGWNLASSHAGGGSVSLFSGLYYKIAGSSEPSTYTWQCSAGGSLMVGTSTFRADNVGHWNLYFASTQGTTGTISQPSMDPAGAESFLAAHAVSWHDTGGSFSSCTSSAGTEVWDLRRTDGSPNTHERGSACYVNSSMTAGGGTDSGATMTVSTGQTSYVAWTWGLGEEPYGPIAATLGGVTASLTGSEDTTPTGDLAATLGGVTASLTGDTTGGSIAATLGGVTASLVGKVKGVRIELLIDDTWTDVSDHVRYDSAVSLTYGRTAEGTTMSTTTANFTLDNRTDTVGNRYSLHNATGIYYGKIGRNTKLRIQDLEFGYRFHGEVSSWTPGADSTNNDQYVELECSGIVRRLDASNSSVQPAMYREVMTNSPLAYWPCDEKSGSFASPIVGVPNMQVSGDPDYGDYSALKCTNPIPQLNKSVWHTPSLFGTDIDNGVTIAFLLASPGGITNDTVLLQPFIDLNDSINGHLRMVFGLTYSGTDELTIQGPNFAGLPTITGTVPIVGNTGVLVYVAIDCNSSGLGNVGLWYQGETDASPVLVGTDTWGYNAGTTGQISLAFNPRAVDLSQNSAAYIGQVAVWDGYGPSNTLEYASVGAHAGEAAGTRFARLCTEEDITHTVNNASNSSLMGPQLPNNVMDLLRECEATDMGIMYELRDDFGLGYVVRRDLYNQDATLELDYSAGDLSSQLQPTFDDKDLKNDVTVQRVNGSSARYVIDANSPLSTQDPPDGVGVYSTSVSVSLATDNQCYPQAGWRAHLGTVDEERITSLGVAMQNARFVASSELRDAAMDVMPGDRITVSDCPDWTTNVNQIVQGYTERFDQFTHDITYNTSSAKPYETAVVPSTTSSTTAKADSLTSTLSADIDDDDTSLSVAVTGVLWSTTAGDFDIIVGGEQMTVTAVSGTSSPQTFTVTRSVNDVTKSHDSGEQVRLYKPAIVGL